MILRPARSTLFPYTTLFRSEQRMSEMRLVVAAAAGRMGRMLVKTVSETEGCKLVGALEDRKSTRLNSSHANISFAVFCLKHTTDHHPELSPLSLHYH